MSDIVNCPKCGIDNCYFDGVMMVCPDCSHEWSESEVESEKVEDTTPRDSNGAELFDGDDVVVIKDLKVRGSSMVVKRGTKVRKIRLTDNHEEIDGKVDGSAIVLKTCFLKK